MSIIGSSMPQRIKDRAVMKGVARELRSLCESGYPDYIRKREIAGGNIVHFATMGDLFAVSINNEMVASNLPRDQSILDIIGRFFDRSIYTTNARKAVDLAGIILAGVPQAVTRIDIETWSHDPESDVLIRSISLDTSDKNKEHILVKLSVFNIDFDIKTKACLDDVKKRLSVLLKNSDDGFEE